MRFANYRTKENTGPQPSALIPSLIRVTKDMPNRLLDLSRIKRRPALLRVDLVQLLGDGLRAPSLEPEAPAEAPERLTAPALGDHGRGGEWGLLKPLVL